MNSKELEWQNATQTIKLQGVLTNAQIHWTWTRKDEKVIAGAFSYSLKPLPAMAYKQTLQT